jgi:hypothetical protein
VAGGLLAAQTWDCNIEHPEIAVCAIVSLIAKLRFSKLLQERRSTLQRKQHSKQLTWYNAIEVVTTFSSFRFPELSQPI